jgi:hypothetical protein
MPVKPLTFLVCPHDTATNPLRWQLLGQYLSQKLDLHIHFEIMLDFADFRDHMTSADLVYANPIDSLQLMQQHGFVAVARPANIYDEAVFVANPEIRAPTLESLNGQPVSSVRSMLPTKIALSMLERQAITPAEVVDHDSWTSVIASIWRNDTPFGIVYKDTYDELSDQGKEMVQLIATSDEQVAFHSMLIGNEGLAYQEQFVQTLTHMDTDDKGIDILHELHFAQWVATTQANLDQMRQVIERFA